MGQGVDEAQRERELTKQQLESSLDKFEARVRAELDWKTRLRQNGARYAVIGVAAVGVLAALIILRIKLRGADEEEDVIHVSSLADIAVELQELRRQVERGKNRDTQPMWQKLAVKGFAAAAAAAGTSAAKSMMDRMSAQDDSEPFDDDLR